MYLCVRQLQTGSEEKEINFYQTDTLHLVEKVFSVTFFLTKRLNQKFTTRKI